MSRVAIWNLNARRSELGGPRKWQIYVFKASTGALVAFGFGLLLFFDLWPVLVASAAVFITSKVCWYLNTDDRPDRWSLFDWICDGVLHFAWLGAWQLVHGDWRFPLLLFVLWLATYAHSSE
jgi:hypothetical protein